VAVGAKKVAGLVGEIAAASAEQAQGVDQINRAVSGMDQVVQKNAASAEESSAQGKTSKEVSPEEIIPFGDGDF